MFPKSVQIPHAIIILVLFRKRVPRAGTDDIGGLDSLGLLNFSRGS
jgi:hypothetical protein